MITWLLALQVYNYAPAVVLPNDSLTPGVIRPDVTAAMVCDVTKTITDEFRVPLSGALRDSVYQTYKAVKRPGFCCQIDHRVPLALAGCATCIANLWPQPYQPFPGAKEKDQFEVWAWRAVCRKRITLEQAQRWFMKGQSWYAMWLVWKAGML